MPFFNIVVIAIALPFRWTVITSTLIMLVGNLALLAWDAERLGPLLVARPPGAAR